jgi:outer membrane receptor for ferrienterochelin and colicins
MTALLVFGSSTRALGQSSRSASAPESVVVTGTRTPENAQRSTVKTDVVTRDEAERRGATNAAEALSSQPGVQVNPGAYGSLGGVSAIQIQGFDRDRVLVLEDGERVVGDIGGAIDLASLPVADLARIEVVTGPTSSLYGTSAIGGVVNLVTQPPQLQGPSGRFRLEARSQPGYVMQGNAAYRRGTSFVGIDGNAVGNRGTLAQPAAPDVPDLRLPDVSRRMVGLRGGFRLASRIDVTARARYFDDVTTGIESSVTPGLGRFVTDLPSHTRRLAVHVVERIDLGGGSNLRVTVGEQAVFGEALKDRRRSVVDEVRSRRHGMQSLEGVLTLADGPRTWVFGARAEAERFSQRLQKTESLSSGPVTREEDEVVPLVYGSAALYGQLAWKLGKLTVLPGVRGELHSRYGGALAPRLASSWRPSEAWQLRASIGRGFRAPSAKELGFVFDHSVYGYVVNGNAQLRPETSWGVNADVSYAPLAELTLRVGGFANLVDDLIDVDLAGGSASAGSVTQYSYVNFGEARTVGGQAGLVVKLGDRFRAEGTYDYLYTRDVQNRRPLGGRPPHTVTAAIRGVPFAKLELSARMRLTSDAFVTAEDRSPGWASLDVRASRPLWSGSQLYVGLTNLLDQHQDPGRTGDLRPPFGRVVYVGLRAELPSEDE